jgi:hypothetical protein
LRLTSSQLDDAVRVIIPLLRQKYVKKNIKNRQDEINLKNTDTHDEQKKSAIQPTKRKDEKYMYPRQLISLSDPDGLVHRLKYIRFPIQDDESKDTISYYLSLHPHSSLDGLLKYVGSQVKTFTGLSIHAKRFKIDDNEIQNESGSNAKAEKSISSRIATAIQSGCRYHDTWVHLDVDTQNSTHLAALEGIFQKSNLSMAVLFTIHTHNGHHIIIDKSVIPERDRDTISVIYNEMKFDWLTISKNDPLIPIPGTFQGGHAVTFSKGLHW